MSDTEATRRSHVSIPEEADSDIGLPFELWRVAFSFLLVPDLCRCSQVCKIWSQLVSSLDSTVWKQHFLSSREWRAPYWPRGDDPDQQRPSWQQLYRAHQSSSRLWAQGPLHSLAQSKCMVLFRKKKEKKTIRVGSGCEHETLKSALGVASDYDRILIAPGIYDEQFEMSSKIPFELMGDGPLGSVVLVMCIEQNALTGRLCNLVLKAPWFTSHVIKVVHGHLQVDNCTLQDGQVLVENPATCHFRYCSFNRLQVALTHVNLSIIENCEFTSNENAAAICVDGFPKEEVNWAHQHMSQILSATKNALSDRPSSVSSYGSLSTDTVTQGDIDASVPSDQSVLSSLEKMQAEVDSIGVASIAGSQESLPHTNSNCSFDTSSLSSFSDGSDLSHPSTQAHRLHLQMGSSHTGHAEVQAALNKADSLDCGSSHSGDTTVVELSGSRGQISSLWSDDGEDHMQANLQTLFSENLLLDPDFQRSLSGIHGCVIRRCKFAGCHGGVTVLRQGHARIEKNEFRDVQYGVRCVQNAKVTVLQNEIHHCSTSGIFMRLAAQGVIAGNDIYCTNEACIDVRKNADPLIQCNKIHHSKRSGIVVLGSGCGTIKSNDIYQNREAGIYILYRGNPHVSGNRIVHGGAAGIAINEEGRGFIIDNLISHNRWGGIDIRHRSDPWLSRNLISNGLADGIVIGQQGRGTIENNTIKGNVGCGIWVMCGQPLIQMNQIYNNNDIGVSFVQNREGEEDYSDAEDSPSEHSLDLGNLHSDEDEEEVDVQNPDAPPLQPQLKYNTIYHNNGYGVLAQSSEAIHLSGNAIHANRDVGINVVQASPVAVLNNSVTCNAGAGLKVAADAKVTAEGNGIYDNNGHGVLVHGELNLVSNDIFSNQMCAIVLENSASVAIEQNRIHAPKDVAICIESQEVTGHVTNNSLYQGAAELTCHKEASQCRLEGNHIINDADSGERRSRGRDWHLENPPPRPHIDAPPMLIPKAPIRRVTTRWGKLLILEDTGDLANHWSVFLQWLELHYGFLVSFKPIEGYHLAM